MAEMELEAVNIADLILRCREVRAADSATHFCKDSDLR